MNTKNTKSFKDTEKDRKSELRNEVDRQSASDKINLDYDWNSEYGDGDIPNIDK